MASSELQSKQAEPETRRNESVVNAQTQEVTSEQSSSPFDRLFVGAPGDKPSNRASQFLSSPAFSHTANNDARVIALKRVQQTHGNRFAQRAVTGINRKPARSAVLQRECACGGGCKKCSGASAASSPVQPLPVSDSSVRLIQSQGAGSDDSNVERSADEIVPPASPGQPIDEQARGLMESRLGTDFSDVRLHTDSKAESSADALDARAYTSGRDIYFAAGQYQPVTQQGQHLLAHELTHVVQQSNGTATSGIAAKDNSELVIGAADHPLEREADSVADAVVSGNGSSNLQSQTSLSIPSSSFIQRKPDHSTTGMIGSEVQSSLRGNISDLSHRLVEDQELFVQAKLVIGAPGDQYEQEADHVADMVVRGGGSYSDNGTASSLQHSNDQHIQPKCAACAAGQPCTACQAEEDKRIQAKPVDVAAPANQPDQSVVNTSDSGTPLSEGVREKVEPVLGADLSNVKVHSDASANMVAKDLGAKAFTHQNHIWLGPQQSPDDVELMAHEATHVVQQAHGVDSASFVQRACACAGTGCKACGKDAEEVVIQPKLEVNAERLFEPEIDTAGPERSSAGKGSGEAAPAKGEKEGGGEKGAKSSDAKSAEGDDDTGGADASGSKSGTGTGGGASPPPGSSPNGGNANAGSPASSAPGGGGETATTAKGSDCKPSCYDEDSEDPPEEPEETPPNPPQGKVEAETSKGDEEDAPEPDDCPAEESQASPAGAPPAGGPPGGAPPAGTPQAGAPQAGAPQAAAPQTPAPAGAPGGAPPAAAPQTAPSPATQSAGMPSPDAAAAPPGTTPPGAAAAPDASPAAPGAQPPAAAPGGGGPPARGSEGGGGGASPEAPLSGGTPLDPMIASAEAQRAESVAAFAASSEALKATSGGTRALRADTKFAAGGKESTEEETRRSKATDRANRFFGGVADQLDQAIALALEQVPDQLGVSAESGKAQIAGSIETQKQSISARIKQARGRARADAAMAKRAVRSQADSYVASIKSQTSEAIKSITATHKETMGKVNELETTTLDSVNSIYAKGRKDLEGLGTTVGKEAIAKGEEFASKYETFRSCTEDGWFDGNLAERRANAQAEAARKVAKGYNDRMVEAAKKRAREVAKAGRKKDRCGVIASAKSTRNVLDDQLAKLTAALETARDAAIQQAGDMRDGLIESINSSLASQLQQLDRQEHDQRQAANDTGYLQQVIQEQIAHGAASAVQQGVQTAITSAQQALVTVQALCAANVPPDLPILEETLLDVEQRISSALTGLKTSGKGGATAAEAQLAGAAQQALGALGGITQGNDELTGTVSGGFTKSMGAIAGKDNFATQRASYTKQMKESTAASNSALRQALTGMSKACDDIKGEAKKALVKAGIDLEKNLRQSMQGIECQITRSADDAASKEPPAWKKVVAVLLVILVIVIIIVVTVVTFGAGLGVIATIAVGVAVGAVVGAVTSGLLAIAGNLWTNQKWSKGVGHAILVGAVTGAIGGGIGAGVGAAFKGFSVAVQLGAAMVTAGALDVITQYVMGGFSFENFSWSNLGLTLLITALTFGLAHKVSARRPTGVPAREGPPPTPHGEEPRIGFGREPAPKPAGTPAIEEPRIGFGREPGPKPAGTPPVEEPRIGFGREPGPKPAGTPPVEEPRIGFGREPAPKPAGAPPVEEPRIGFGREPGPKPAGTPPVEEPRIGFGREPGPKPAGTPPVEEPRIGFGREPGPKPPPPPGPPAPGPVEPPVLGPRPTSGPGRPATGSREGTTAIQEGTPTRAMANDPLRPTGTPSEPTIVPPHEEQLPVLRPHEDAPPVRPPQEEAPAVIPPKEEPPVAPPQEELAPTPPPEEPLPVTTPEEDLAPLTPQEEVSPGATPKEEPPPMTTPKEETPPTTTPKEEAPPTATPKEEPPTTPKTGEEPSPKPWEVGEQPRRYRGYVKRLAKRNPGQKALEPEQWWNEIGSKPPRNPGGGEGKPDHRSAVEDLYAKALAKYPPPKYRVTSNKRVPGVGEKSDVAVIENGTDKVVVVYEAARFNKSGNLIRPDEKAKIPHYEGAGIPYEFHPVGPNAPEGGVLKSPTPEPPPVPPTPEPTPPVPPKPESE